MSTPREVRASLSKIANAVYNGEIDPKRANAILYACNAILNAIRTDEQERKLDELERLVKERVDR